MRRIDRTGNFRRDYKRVKSTPRYRDIDALLSDIIKLLATDQPLPAKNRDHGLTSNWIGFRDCHVRPDLVLIYEKQGHDVLVLTRLGSPSDLFG
jgi:mRNA interferase YafQ